MVNNSVHPKLKIIMVLSNWYFFRYCNSQYWIFAIASCKAITLYLLCLIYGISSLLLFLNYTLPNIAIVLSEKKWQLLLLQLLEEQLLNEEKYREKSMNQCAKPRQITTTPPHLKYQNNDIDDDQMKMSKFDTN